MGYICWEQLCFNEFSRDTCLAELKEAEVLFKELGNPQFIVYSLCLQARLVITLECDEE